jgi:hypothetical protein
MRVKVTVKCEFAAPVIAFPAGNDFRVTLSRYEENRVMLDARGTSGGNPNQELRYSWTLYSGPTTLGSINSPIDGMVRGALVHDAQISLASAVLFGAGDYTFKLTVTDGCSTSEGYITYHASCEVKNPPLTSDLITIWKGQTSVPNLVFAYDYLDHNPEASRGLQCQANDLGAYKWEVYDYQPVSPPPHEGGSDEFVKTAGFGVLMAFVGLVVIGAPIGIFFYMRRKNGGSCFKKSPDSAQSKPVNVEPRNDNANANANANMNASGNAPPPPPSNRQPLMQGSNSEMATMGSTGVDGTPATATSPV